MYMYIYIYIYTQSYILFQYIYNNNNNNIFFIIIYFFIHILLKNAIIIHPAPPRPEVHSTCGLRGEPCGSKRGALCGAVLGLDLATAAAVEEQPGAMASWRY